MGGPLRQQGSRNRAPSKQSSKARAAGEAVDGEEHQRLQAAKCVGFNSAGNQTEAQVLKNGQAGSPRACHGADIDHAARAELCQVSLISVSCKEQKQGQRLSAAAQDQACRGCGRRRMHSASRCALHS